MIGYNPGDGFNSGFGMLRNCQLRGENTFGSHNPVCSTALTPTKSEPTSNRIQPIGRETNAPTPLHPEFPTLSSMRPSRKALRVLTLLTLAGGAALLVLGIHVSLVARLHASAAALASVGFLVVLLSLVGFVGAGRDKSALLMGYFFANFVLLTVLFVASYAALAFQDSLVAWLKHNWTSPVLAYLRSKECCRDGFEATTQFVHRQFLLLGILGLVCLALVLMAMYCVVRIVTVPIVMKSLLTVLNAVFCLLGAVLIIFAAVVQSKHEPATSGHQWIAIVFLVTGTLLIALAGLGIVGARAKSRSMLLLVRFRVVGLSWFQH
jgi:hypothetical protein